MARGEKEKREQEQLLRELQQQKVNNESNRWINITGGVEVSILALSDRVILFFIACILSITEYDHPPNLLLSNVL